MIFEILLDLIFGILNVLCLPFKAISFGVNTDFFSSVMEYLNVIFYIIPIQNFVPIIVFLIATMGMRILISLVKTLWAMLPFI